MSSYSTPSVFLGKRQHSYLHDLTTWPAPPGKQLLHDSEASLKQILHSYSSQSPGASDTISMS